MPAKGAGDHWGAHFWPSQNSTRGIAAPPPGTVYQPTAHAPVPGAAAMDTSPLSVEYRFGAVTKLHAPLLYRAITAWRVLLP